MNWKRNLWIIWFSEFTSIIGFAIVMPILPFYVQELGVTDPDAVTFWSGAIFSAQAVTMGIMAPIWGALADRLGRKPMVVRAMFGGAVVIGLMGFATNVQQLVFLRALQGMLTGTVTAATALVAGTTPKERSGYALGTLQMGIYTGASVGPLLGGIISDTLSMRATFWATSGLLLIGGLMVTFLVHENFQPSDRGSDGKGKLLEGFRLVLASRALLTVFSIRLMMRIASRMMGPILPLFVQSMVVSDHVATLSGIVRGANAALAALGAVILGRLGDRYDRRTILLVCTLALAIVYTPHFFATNVVVLTLLQAAAGFAMGGVLATLSATLATFAPENKEGAVYGLDASIVSTANAVAPMVGTSIAVAWVLPAPFLAAALLFAVVGLISARLLPRVDA
jgi:DHA1 family multidrug resistance protein-like MFS transporter